MSTDLAAPVSPNIETAFLAGLQAQREEHVGKEAEFFWASSIGQCPRAQVARRAGLPPTSPPDNRAIFKMWAGTVMHQAAQALLVSAGYLDPTSVEQRGTYECYSFKVDGITPTVEGGAVVEVKTTDDDAITRYADLPAHYRLQGTLCCMGLHIPRLIVFQVGRSQGLVRHRVFYIREEDEQYIDTLVKEMADHWARWKAYGELPPHQHNFAWEDRYCAYREPREGTNERAVRVRQAQ